MRVTQSMLSNNMLRNLNTSYGKMSKLQELIQSGKKITRPSDDPVIAVRGMGHRTELTKIEQYQRNTNEVNSWLDTTDEALDQVGNALHRVRELVVQVANDTNTQADRENILAEISQMRLQIQDLGNTKVSGNYIFSGTKTNTPLFVGGAKNTSADALHAGMNNSVKVDISDGIQLQMNTPGQLMFDDIDNFMEQLENLLQNGATGEQLTTALGATISTTGGTPAIPGLDVVFEDVLTKRADIGARMNRLEMMENRLDIQFVNKTKRAYNKKI